MVFETYTPLFHEIFLQVNNAKDKSKKIAILRKYKTKSLEQFLKAAFDPKIEWLIPEGDVPYMPNDAPDGTEHTRLEREVRQIANFVVLHRSSGPNVEGNPNINRMRREMMFIQLLEGLSSGEAECLIMAKEGTLGKKYKGLTASAVREAFKWNATYSGYVS